MIHGYTKRRGHILAFSYLITAVLVLGIFAGVQYQRAERYRLQDWAGYNECRPRTPRTKRWLLYLTFADGSALRAEGCGAAPRSHDKWEDELLALLNSCIDL